MRNDPAMLGASSFERLELDSYFTLDAEMAVQALLDTGLLNLDIQRGEMISIRTQLAVQSLRHLIERETARQKAKEEKKNDA